MESNDLKCEGWYVSQDGFDFITAHNSIKDKKGIIANALNTDIKDFGEPILSSEIKQSKTGKVVLQIQKIRNVAAPKSKEESQAAPRMLKIILTDGHTNCQAVEISNIPSLSRTNTPPGSKLLINNAKIFSSCILLHPKCCTLLGGRVPALYEKWETAKNISDHMRCAVVTDGAPPWVNFGEKMISLSNEPFKSLITKTSKETTNEFDIQRQDAIAVASTGAVKKVFGGGAKTIQDNQFTNQKYNSGRENYENRINQEGNKEHIRGFRNKREVKEKVMEKPSKPLEKISLFDFLENKLLVNEVDVKPNSKSSEDNNYYSKQEGQRVNTQRKEIVRNNTDSNSPRFHHQKYAGNPPAQSFGNNYVRYPKSNNREMTNTSGIQANNSFTKDPVDSLSRNLGKMSVNSQFATRSLQQHLNLGNNKNEPKVNSNVGGWNWRIGDLCMAKYWEDGKYYNASVTNLTERTCVVQFSGYGNVEEVLKVDCIPISDHDHDLQFNAGGNQKRSAGFRFSRRPYSNNRPFNKAT